MSARTVWKFPLLLAASQEIEVPEGAELLFVAVQKGQLCLWALVDPGQPLVSRTIRVVGTGHGEVEDGMVHLGSVLMDEGHFVWHVFFQPVVADVLWAMF